MFFTHCESCTRPISTNPGSMEAGEYELYRVGRVSSHAVSRWSRSPGCCGFRGVFRVRQDFVFSIALHFQIRRAKAVSVDSVKGQRQPANLPTENSRPPIPTRCTIYCAPTCESWRRLISKLAHRPTSQSDLRPHESNLNHFSSSESTSRHCSRDRALRQTYARGVLRHLF